MSQIITALTRLGLVPPTELVAAFAVREAANGYCLETDGAEHRLGSDIATGKITADGIVKALRDAALARMVRGAAKSVNNELDRNYRQAEKRAVQSAGPALVAQLRPVAAAALTRIADAVAITGATPNAKVGNAGPAVHHALGELSGGIAMMANVGVVTSAMVDSGYYANVAVADVLLWIPVDSDGPATERARVIASAAEGNRFAAMAAAGIPLGLNDADEVAALVARAAEHATSATRPRVPVVDPKQARMAGQWDALVPRGTAA